jgi:hypothetical protein
METAKSQTRCNLLKPGAYRVRMGECHIIEDRLGTWVVIRFDLLEKGLAHRSIKAWTNAELIGGERPSELYSWISALEFGGEALPEGYSLEKADLLLRKAWAVIAVIDGDGVPYNRVVQLLPLRGAGRGDWETRGHGDTGAASQERGKSVDFSPNPQIPAESEVIFDGEPPW